MASSAEVLHPIGTVNGAEPPTFTSFHLSEPSPVDASVISAGSSFVPLFLDDAAAQVVFAEVPESLDLRREAFAFVEAHRHAVRLVALSFDELTAVAANAAPPAQLVFVFNTSRCGSTLLHRVFNTVPRVSSIGELSIVADIERLARAVELRALAQRLLHDSLHVVAAAYGGTVSFKHLAGCTNIADLHHAAFPQASLLFLYRNALDWAASWQRFRERDGLHDAPMGMWLDAMDAYLRCRAAGTPISAVRYEDLVDVPAQTLDALFDVLGWTTRAIGPALGAFGRDAQAGTELARVNGGPNPYRLTPAQRTSVDEQLRRHRPRWDTAPMLDGTLRPGH